MQNQKNPNRESSSDFPSNLFSCDVIILSATNRLDILDPALLRAGHFDRQITVDLPAMQEGMQADGISRTGHAMLAALLPHADPIHKVTIVPRGRAMGVTQQNPEKDKYVYPREYILNRLTVMKGSRAAEQIVFKTSTSGASNDLKQATQLARKLVLDWGMSDKFAQMALGKQRKQVFLGEEIAHRREYSEDTAREVDEEIRAILKNTYQRSGEILEEHRQEIDELVDILIEKEEIPGAEVMKLVGKEQREDRPSTPQTSLVQESHDGSHGKD